MREDGRLWPCSMVHVLALPQVNPLAAAALDESHLVCDAMCSYAKRDVAAQLAFRRTSSRGADHGKGLINISAGSSTRGPMPLGQK